MKKKQLLFLLGIGIGLTAISCNRDDNGNSTQSNDLNTKAGRFDNKPFSWDVQTKQNQNGIFLGDLNVGVNGLNASASNGSNLGTANGNVFINSANVYPGAVFPKPSIDSYAFDAEIRYDKSPYDLNFMFPMPYSIEDIDSSKGLSNYNKKISEALNSANFTNYINSGYKKEVDYSATEVYNYEDVKKAFSFNTKLGGLFSTKMTENKHNQKYSSIYFARLVSTSFDVIFDQNRDGFFKSGEINKDLQNAGSSGSGGGRNGFGSSNGTPSQYFASGEPYFIKQMSYGKFAYLAIESEYSYSEVKRTIEATFDAWKISGKAEYSEEIKRVLSKSTVTVFSTGDSGVESYWGTSLDNLYSMFKVTYNSNFYGYPVYTQIRSVKDDKLYTPPTILYNEDRGTSGNGGDRSGNGFQPNPNPNPTPNPGGGGRR
ncbi:hemolysin [Elizabethkingia anophelis]|uniref:hemolysin n=1 Tax=Elizabethkingia anophelis TaxID=1117645 RepID=UPI00200C0F4C|nr:hemolysin [Elizabethkingia anophelis]MCL1034670.1 hemolysin [Elizabethkingia anophelis]